MKSSVIKGRLSNVFLPDIQRMILVYEKTYALTNSGSITAELFITCDVGFVCYKIYSFVYFM